MPRGHRKKYRSKRRNGFRPILSDEIIQRALESVPDYQFLPYINKYIVNCESHFHLRLECYIHNGDRNYRADTHGLKLREYYDKNVVEMFLKSDSELEFQQIILNKSQQMINKTH